MKKYKSRGDALLGSVKKWESVVFEGQSGRSWPDCPCCTYRDTFIKKDCKGCPIMAVTGEKACRNTPYYDYYFGKNAVATMEAAIQEYLFLSMLYHEYYGEE